jgi:hypothetical protein
MGSLYRQCITVGAIYLLASVVIVGGYFFHFRPGWMTPEVLVRTPAFLADPATSAAQLRETALKGHQVIVDGFAALDAAIVFMLILSIGAAAMLIYAGTRIRNSDTAL